MTTTTARPSVPLPTTDAGQSGDSCPAPPTTAQPGVRAGGERPVERRRRRTTNPLSARALAMLMQRPIFAASLPQLHIGPRRTDGSMLVDDRATGRRVLVYTPRLNSQFRAGYRAGLWYLRAEGDAEPSPRSSGFPTAGAAVDTLRPASGGPRLPTAPSLPRCRVIWS
jgi:hypothetical protein